MFKNYIFKKQDFAATEKAISMAYDKKLEHVFLHGLSDFDLVSYDSKFIYLWSRNDYPDLEKFKDSVCGFKIYRFLHKRQLAKTDFAKMGLATGDFRLGGEVFKEIPQKLTVHVTPLTAWIRRIRKSYNIPKKEVPYEKAYYHVILLHEIAHFHFFKKFNFKTPAQEKILKLAKSLVETPKRVKPLSKSELNELFTPKDIRALGEVFSTLVELEATKVFYPKYLRKTIDQMVKYSKKHLEDEVGDIETAINANLYGKIVAIYIFKSFPNWSEEFHKLM